MEKLPLDRSCPKCRAKAGETCKNEKGLVIRGVHSERWPKKRTPHEDVNQAAARVVREATEK